MNRGMSRSPLVRSLVPSVESVQAEPDLDPPIAESEVALWRVLDELGPLIELLEVDDGDEGAAIPESDDARLEAMLVLIDAGLDRGRRSTPAFVLHHEARNHAAFTPDERARISFLVDALTWADLPAHPVELLSDGGERDLD